MNKINPVYKCHVMKEPLIILRHKLDIQSNEIIKSIGREFMQIRNMEGLNWHNIVRRIRNTEFSLWSPIVFIL
jgi:hypothetical protein